MKLMRTIGGLIIIVASAMRGTVFAQTPALPVALNTYLQEQYSLANGWQALVSQGATQQQVDAWFQQNASRFQTQQLRAQALGAESAAQQIPLLTEVNIPSGASSQLADFLATQASLANARALLHNQLFSSSQSQLLGALQQQEGDLFRQQHSAELQLQSQRAQVFTTVVPQSLPPPGAIPSGLPPRLKAYLLARNALVSDWAKVWNSSRSADFATRQTALQQWQKQNASRIQQLRTLLTATSVQSSN